MQQGYDLLQQDAAQLDEKSRQRFLTGVAIHRDLVATYQALQETGETGHEKNDRKPQTADSLVSPVPPISCPPISCLRLGGDAGGRFLG